MKNDAPLSASEMLRRVSERIATLHALSESLDETIGKTLCDVTPVPPDTLWLLQSVDYLRQSIGDLSVMLCDVSPQVRWDGDPSDRIEATRQRLHLRDSVDLLSQVRVAQSSDPTPDIWL